MRKFISISIAALAIAIPASQAQVPPPPFGHAGGGAFGLLSFDANADGKLTRAELDSELKTRFAAQDANKDGTISRDERKAAGQAKKEEARKAHFAAMDKDRNGQLSEAELEAGRPGKMGLNGEGGRPKGGDGHGRGGRHGHGGEGMGGKDGMSLAEFTSRATERFTLIDANKDGVVTVAEMKAAPGPGQR